MAAGAIGSPPNASPIEYGAAGDPGRVGRAQSLTGTGPRISAVSFGQPELARPATTAAPPRFGSAARPRL